MKKYQFIFLFVLLFFSSFFKSYAFVNGSFDGAGGLKDAFTTAYQGSFYYSNVGYNNSVGLVETSTCTNNNGSFLYGSNPNLWHGTAKLVSVVPGKQYTFKVKVKKLSGNPTASVFIFLYDDATYNNNEQINVNMYVPGLANLTGDWQTIQHTFTVPAGKTWIGIRPDLNVLSNGYSVVWDDFELISDVPPSPPTITSYVDGQLIGTTSPTITWNFNDAGDTQSKFQVVGSTNGFGAWHYDSGVISSADKSFNIPGLALWEGQWSFAVRTWDAAGNGSTDWGYRVNLRLDGTPPTIGVAADGPLRYTNAADGVVIRYHNTNSQDANGVEGVYWWGMREGIEAPWYTNASKGVAWSDGQVGYDSFFDVPIRGEGTYLYVCHPYDNAGIWNWGQRADERMIVDRQKAKSNGTGPITYTPNVSGTYRITDTNVRDESTVTNAVSGVNRVEWWSRRSVDRGATWEAWQHHGAGTLSGGNAFFDIPLRGLGYYEVHRRIYDNAGNVTEPYDFSGVTYFYAGNTPTLLYAKNGATAQGRKITVIWNANGNPSGTVYELEASNDGVSGWTLVYTDVNTGFIHTGITDTTNASPGVIKYYRVRAKHAAGVYTPYSAVVQGNTLASPNVSSVITSGGTSSGKVKVSLNWAAVTGAQKYNLIIFDGLAYRVIDIGNVTSWNSDTAKIYPTPAQIAAWDGISNPFRNGDGTSIASSLNDLYMKSGGDAVYKTYSHYLWLHVVSVDSAGDWSGDTWNGACFVGGVIPDSVAPNQTTLSFGTVTSNSITVNAAVATDKYMTGNANGSGISPTGYRFYDSITTQKTDWNNGTGTITGLTPNTRYNIGVSTMDVAGNDSIYNDWKDKYTLANVPVTLTASNETAYNKIDLSWGANSNPVTTIYELEVSNDGSSGWTNIYTGTATSYSHVGLNYNMTKYYRVKAKNAEGVYTAYTSNATGKTTYDLVAPTVVVTANTADTTNANSITYTFTFSEAVTGFDGNDVTVTNGVKGNFTIVSTSEYKIEVTNGSTGNQIVSANAGVCTDLAGNQNLAGSKTIAIDKVNPTVTITTDKISPTNSSSIKYRMTFSKNVTGFDASDITISTGTKGTFTPISGMVYEIIVTNTGDATQTFTVPAGVCTDSLGNTNLVGTKVMILDKTSPTVVVTTTPGSGPTNANTVTYTMTFNEKVNGFDADDITVTNGTKGLFTVVNGLTYKIEVAYVADGMQTINIANGVCTDDAGNVNTSGSGSIMMDKTKPTVVITASPSANPTNANSITYTIVFSENVTTFTTDDIAVTNGVKGLFTAVNATTYTLVTTYVADGTQVIAVAGGAGLDAAGNESIVSSTSVVMDRTAPTVTINASPSVSPTNASSITYTFVFSEAVSGFDAADVTVTNGTKGLFTSVSATNYTLVVTNAGTTTQTVSIGAGVCTDLVGNNNTAGSKTVVIDRTAPTVVITASPSVNPTNAGSITYTFTFSEAVTGFATGDITVTNGVKGLFTAVSATVYTLEVSNTGSTSQTVSIGAGVCADLVGNNNTAGSKNVSIDRDGPAVVIVTNGNSTYLKTQSTVVNVSDINGIGSSEYIYSPSITTPGSGFTAFTTGSTLTTPAGLTGDYYLHIKTTDSLGNISNVRSNVFKLDNTAPTMPTINGNGSWSKVNENVTITAGVDTMSGVNKTEYRLTGATTLDWTTYVGSFVISNEGNTTIEARTIDNLLNTSSVVSKVIMIDKTLPTGSITPNEQSTWIKVDIPFTVTTSDNLSGIVTSEIRYSSNGGSTYTGWSAITRPVYNQSLTAEGTRVIQVRLVDAAGNENIITSSQYLLDKTAPTISVSNVAAETEVDVVVTSADALSGLHNTESYKYYYTPDGDSEIQSAYMTSNTYKYAGLKQNERYTFKQEAKDKAGNSVFNTFTVTKGAKDSKVEIVTIEENTLKLSVIGDVANKDVPETKIIATNIENPVDKKDSGWSRLSIVTLTGFEKGSKYKIEAITRSDYGLENPTKMIAEAISFIVDNSAPLISEYELNYGDKATQNRYVDVKLIATDDKINVEGLLVQFEIPGYRKVGYVDGAWQENVYGKYQKYYPGLDLGPSYGNKVVYVKVKDEADNVSSRMLDITYNTKDIIVPKVEENKNTDTTNGEIPQKTTSNGMVMTKDRLVTLKLKATDAVQAQYSLDSIKWSPWEPVRNGEITKKITLDDQKSDTKTVYARSKNALGRVSAMEVTYYVLDQTPPTIDLQTANNVNIAVGGKVDLRMEFNDKISKEITYTVTFRKDGVVKKTKTGTVGSKVQKTESFTGLEKGFYSIKVEASDELGNKDYKTLNLWSK